MRRPLTTMLLLLCAVACTTGPSVLQNPAISEASGLARSQRNDELFWLINDGGHKPVLYATDASGRDLGTVAVDGAGNRDWEDIASFTYDGQAMLLIADIGDNLALRQNLTLYAVNEPEADDRHVSVAWSYTVVLPDGAADAEAIAVDSVNDTVILLSKRDIPAVLYQLPLHRSGDSSEPVVAERIGTLDSLPQPSESDRANARRLNDWHWQPTAMDIADDGMAIAVLTYRAVYVYQREPGQSIAKALQFEPRKYVLEDLPGAEAAAFTRDGNSVLVTTEQRHAPIRRIGL